MRRGIARGFVFLAVLVLCGPWSQAQELEKLVVLGSRFEERSVSDSPVPVDVITEEEMLATGQTEVGRVIQELIPSFNFSSSTISDGTDALRPATLRGLGPDQVLVLVNGKRRHKSALVHVNTSVGRGTSGVDMNSIPLSAIKRIEVLRDGSSAQYGSDAISGVVNIVLKDTYEGKAAVSMGQRREGDGDTWVASVSKGFSLWSEESVLNATLEIRDREMTNRAGPMGDIQYSASQCRGEGGAAVSCGDVSSPRTLTDNSVNDPERSINRSQFRVGDADSKHTSLVLNMESPVDLLDDGKIYSFADFSVRNNESGGFYRRANQFDRNPVGSDYPNGFLPLIRTKINDYAFGAGFEANVTESVKMDVSYVTGGNTFAYNITNSHNATWVACKVQPNDASGDPRCLDGVDYGGAIPSSADAGTLKLYHQLVNLDFSTPMAWGNFALGGEYRREKFEIEAGERYSYENYLGLNNDGSATPGIQVFPGFAPENEVSETRNAFSAYADAEFDVGERLLLSPAVRWENYSDFGNTFNGKISARAAVTDFFALRGSASTGFRAPSMQQIYSNHTSTQFNPLPGGGFGPSQVRTYRNDSQVAKQIGIPQLKEETSNNFSAGFVLNPVPSLTVTTDFYYITIEDRIVLPGRIDADDEDISAAARAVLRRENVQQAQFFMNAADTRTRGVDIVASWDYSFAPGSDLNVVLAGTVNETDITAANLPESLDNKLFNEQSRSIIEEWQPKDRFSLSGTYSRGVADLTLAVHRYGKYTVIDGNDRQTFGSEYLTDVNLNVRMGRVGTLKIGANNLFDVKPDMNKIGQSRSGTIYDHDGSTIVDSPGVFTYSRRAAPFGFNGGYYYLAYEYAF